MGNQNLTRVKKSWVCAGEAMKISLRLDLGLDDGRKASKTKATRVFSAKQTAPVAGFPDESFSDTDSDFDDRHPRPGPSGLSIPGPLSSSYPDPSTLDPSGTSIHGPSDPSFQGPSGFTIPSPSSSLVPGSSGSAKPPPPPPPPLPPLPQSAIPAPPSPPPPPPPPPPAEPLVYKRLEVTRSLLKSVELQRAVGEPKKIKRPDGMVVPIKSSSVSVSKIDVPESKDSKPTWAIKDRPSIE